MITKTEWRKAGMAAWILCIGLFAYEGNARDGLERLPSDLVEVSGASPASLSGLASGSSAAQDRQKTAVAETGLPLEVKSAKTGIAFRLVPAGSYTRGSSKSEQDQAVAHGASRSFVDREHPQHTVTISKPFYCGQFPVTQGQWQQVMGKTPSRFNKAGSDAPVESVSWNDCQEFLRKLCELEGVPQGTYRMLTEAQWEYACRAGTQTPFYFGDRLDSTMANINGNHPYGGAPKGPNRRTTTPVGQFKPNAFGLYDMHGNVCEWVQDLYGDYGSKSVIEESVTEPLDTVQTSRVSRGGSCSSSAMVCRSASRGKDLPEFPDGTLGPLGFRLQRTAPNLP
jgi:formylglycine-generating enzyme required for sulfatase activity